MVYISHMATNPNFKILLHHTLLPNFNPPELRSAQGVISFGLILWLIGVAVPGVVTVTPD